MKGKISRIDLITIIIAFAALITSVFSIYFQFFDNYTRLSAKYIGANTSHNDEKEELNSGISFLFLNTGKTEVAFISGFVYLSADGSVPKYHFSASRSSLDDQQKKWFTNPISPNFIVEPGKIEMKDFSLKIPYKEAIEYFEQNFDLLAKESLQLNAGVSLNFIDSRGKLKMVNFQPSKIELKYFMDEEELKIIGTGSNVNPREKEKILGKYKIY